MIFSEKMSRLKNIPHNILVSFRLLGDNRISLRQKIIFIGLAMGYVIWPWDFIFDVPIVGQIDDLTVFVLLYSWLLSRIPLSIREEHGWKTNK